ncbi:NAD-dependent epimerase/dehydratase family protein [uncultured Aquimarina sp.]|uniref:NAD-dependent epimerase/dehydratase family protein n=1 Tax=uncultured Aquimarina sp. TaxID=575652 RepID=UPI0026022B48|nr:NAD-dependent epimerase/dehydratase family protein [uncultured Aquimarina sp.]
MEGLSNNRILITGITGFTGKHLEEFYKKNGYDVYGTTFSKSNDSNHFFCDITKKEEINAVITDVRPDYIIHTAAISFVAGENQNEMYKVNVFGTLNLLESVLEAKIFPKKIIIASSAAVYGSIAPILSEDLCPKPVNHYGNSKLAMENMVQNYFHSLNIIITRPFNYTGVGQAENFLIPKIIRHFKNKAKIIELGNINVYREFNDVNYLIKCYHQLLLSKESSIIINVCSSKTYTIQEIINCLEEITNHKIEVKINEKYIRKNEIESLRGSTKMLNDFIVNNTSSDYSLKETLKKMYLS